MCLDVSQYRGGGCISRRAKHRCAPWTGPDAPTHSSPSNTHAHAYIHTLTHANTGTHTHSLTHSLTHTRIAHKQVVHPGRPADSNSERSHRHEAARIRVRAGHFGPSRGGAGSGTGGRRHDEKHGVNLRVGQRRLLLCRGQGTVSVNWTPLDHPYKTYLTLPRSSSARCV